MLHGINTFMTSESCSNSQVTFRLNQGFQLRVRHHPIFDLIKIIFKSFLKCLYVKYLCFAFDMRAGTIEKLVYLWRLITILFVGI